MTLEDIKKKYAELIPNLGSIKDPEREVSRDILTQMKKDFETMVAKHNPPLPFNPTLGEAEDGEPHKEKGYCVNFWQFIWFGGLGSWYIIDVEQVGGYQGDGSDASIQKWLQSGCAERCKPKQGCVGWLCQCMGGEAMVKPGSTSVTQGIMGEEYTRMKTMWNYKIK